MKRAALYMRVSTEEQARHGLSLPEQRTALEAYAAKHELAVSGFYEDCLLYTSPSPRDTR